MREYLHSSHTCPSRQRLGLRSFFLEGEQLFTTRRETSPRILVPTPGPVKSYCTNERKQLLLILTVEGRVYQAFQSSARHTPVWEELTPTGVRAKAITPAGEFYVITSDLHWMQWSTVEIPRSLGEEDVERLLGL
jgi:hypothetical protein